jgi:hypothetical protein
LDAGPAGFAEGVEELAEYVLVTALADEHHPAGVMVGDDSQKLAVFAVGDA